MRFKVQKMVNPRNPQGPKFKHATPVNAGHMTLKDFAMEIAGRSSLTRGDIENVLSNFLDELPAFLKIGMSVQLGEYCIRSCFKSIFNRKARKEIARDAKCNFDCQYFVLIA